MFSVATAVTKFHWEPLSSSSSSSSRFVERITQTPLMRYDRCPSVSRCAANRQHARSIKILSHYYSASSVLAALSVSSAIITVFVKLLEIFSRLIIHPNNFCNVTVRCTAARCGSVQPTRLSRRLHVPIVGPTGRSDPGYVRLSVRPVGQTVRTDCT